MEHIFEVCCASQSIGPGEEAGFSLWRTENPGSTRYENTERNQLLLPCLQDG